MRLSVPYLVFVILLFNFVTSDKDIIQNNQNVSNTFAYPYPNIIRSSNIKRISAAFGYKPGVHYSSQLSKITSSENQPLDIPNVSKTKTKSDIGIIENVVESQLLIVRDPFNTTHEQLTVKPQRGSVIDWFLGLVGIRPPDPNPPNVVPVKTCPSCTCGRVLKHKRIVGGIETVINGYPWMTALMYNNRFYCGGSLINNKYVLTAAHCVNGFSRERLSAVFLDHDRSTPYETQTQMRKIQNIFRHSSYGNGASYNNDIALLRLDQEVSFTGLLKPVCLPPTGKSFTGYEGIVVGWGATKEHGSISNKLLEVTVPIISNINCTKTGYGSRITENMMCAGYRDGKKDSCQGDSGGPLHVMIGTIYQIVGIVSWGDGCAKPNYPGVYTRVNRYITWIKTNTRDACYC